jgi:nitrogen fixation protein FixH
MGPIPAKYFWPGLVTLLLVFSVSSGIATLMAAKSGNGPQIMPEEPLQGEQLQKHLDKLEESNKLGWSVAFHPSGIEPSGEPVDVEIEMTGPDGEPITDLEGSVALKRPSLAGTQGKDRIEPVSDRPGVYRVELPITQRGLWDFAIQARRGEQLFLTTERHDIVPSNTK